MTGERGKDSKFGALSVEMNFVDQEKVDKALVVQKRVFEKTRVSMPIGEILMEMGAITCEERDEILKIQDTLEGKKAPKTVPEIPEKKCASERSIQKEGSSLDITVSKDKLTALAYIDGDIPATEFDVSDVKIMLLSDGIRYGIAADRVIKAFLNGDFCVGERWAIATGTEPIPDTPPQIIYHFDTDPLKIGTLTEDGLMDWKDRGRLPQVKAGDLLAEKIPSPGGETGVDVFGNEIPIPKLRELQFKCGKGARKSADGMQVHASLSGIPKRSLSGEISVVPTLHIQGDISLETGHVDFDGHIEVAGAVEKGYKVKGGSLRANEIREARIEIDGDISSTNGIFGTTIKCGGNLKAGHIHNSDIILAGDMAVEKEIIEAKIEANGRCLVNDGIIISSGISAKMGITAMDIGTEASKSSELTVGIDRQMERDADTIRDEIQAIKTDQDDLQTRLETLKKQSDEVNTQLGEVAQQQDKCMVQHRRLQEKIETGLLKQGDAAAKTFQKTISDLKTRQEAYDEEVALLMEADETIDLERAATEKSITDSATTIQELNARLNAITDAQKQAAGMAMVKIGGNIFSGTKITGPHSALVLQEDLKRLSILETDKPDHEGSKQWRFEVIPFR